jgi:hypothetical protein
MNCLIMFKPVEQAFDQHRIVIVPVETEKHEEQSNKEWILKVADSTLRKVDIFAGMSKADCTLCDNVIGKSDPLFWKDLDGRTVFQANEACPPTTLQARFVVQVPGLYGLAQRQQSWVVQRCSLAFSPKTMEDPYAREAVEVGVGYAQRGEGIRFVWSSLGGDIFANK